MTAENASSAVLPFDIKKYARSLSELEARLSRGFLLSQPAKWFPGFELQWIPLLHSFGIEAKIKVVKPVLRVPEGLEIGYAGTVDDEALAIMLNRESALSIARAVTPSTVKGAEDAILEYFARRLLSSLAISWSGPESSVVQFDPALDAQHVRCSAAVLMELNINGRPCQIWFVLGRYLVESLDGLWKRQMRSTVRQGESASALAIEAAQLAVPPSMLSDYVKPRAVIDLEVAASDRVVLRSGTETWRVARLCDVEGKLGLEMLNEAAPMPQLPEGTTRITIEFGRIEIEQSLAKELTQAGSVFQTELPLSSDVQLMINNETVSHAELMIYEGRLAMRIK